LLDRREEFEAWLSGLVEQNPGLAIIPVTDASVPACLQVREKVPALCAALPAKSAYEAVIDKFNLQALATGVGIQVPRTDLVSRANEEIVINQDLIYPVVVKPRRSATVLMNGRVVRRGVAYAADKAAFRRVLSETLLDESDELLVQQVVKGHGMGIFTFSADSSTHALFAHRRLREKPPSGGVSVLSESIAMPQGTARAVERLLEAQRWKGPAMAEFKVDANGTPWLMEINARLWGSVQLAVDCGVDFPFLTYQSAMKQQTTLPTRYKSGRQLRWGLGDLDNLYLQLRDSGNSISSKLEAAGRFLLPWRPGRSWELFRFNDPLPALSAAVEYLKAVA
jgi:predicted ATP-grasp superfamily ATP-dependent carboligase